MPMTDTSHDPRKAVRYALIAVVTLSLAITLVGPVVVLTTDTGGVASASEDVTSVTVWDRQMPNDESITAVTEKGDGLYVGTAAGNLYYLDARSGDIEWSMDIGTSNIQGIAIDRPRNALYLGLTGGEVVKVDLDTQTVSYRLSESTRTDSIDVNEDTGMFFYSTATGGDLKAYHSNGTQAWSTFVEDTAGAVAYVPKTDSVFVQGTTDTGGRTMYEYDTSGGQISTGQAIGYAAHVNDDGGIMAGAIDGGIAASNASTNSIFYSNTTVPQQEAFYNDTYRELYAGHASSNLLVFDPHTGTTKLNVSTPLADTPVVRRAYKVNGHKEIVASSFGNITRIRIEPKPTLSGQVTDGETDAALAGANVTVTQNGSEVANTTTGSNGYYNVTLDNGTYTVTADKSGYFSQSATVTVSGQNVIQDIALAPLSSALQIETRGFLEHGQSTPYTVVFENQTDDGTVGRMDVTADAVVSSGNTSVITIDRVEKAVIATQDTAVNQRAYIRAEYTAGDGTTYVAEKNVTVANETVENMEILPSWNRTSASFTDTTIQALIVATFMGIIGARVATSFAGLGMMQITIMAGWFVGYVSIGMAMVSLFTALFIGLNMAANIDYTVRR
jgi:hypothetical protein